MRDLVEVEIKNLLKRKQGRAFLAWVMYDICGLMRSSFATNALINAHREGERNVALRLHAELERIHPEGLMEMYREFTDDRRNKQHRRTGNDDDHGTGS